MKDRKQAAKDQFEYTYIRTYGFGCMGLGLYIYDYNYNLVFFLPDIDGHARRLQQNT